MKILRNLIHCLRHPLLPAPDRSTVRNWNYYVREWRAAQTK